MMCRWAPGLGCPSELRAGQSGPCAYPLSGASTGFAPPRPCALECERVCDMEADPASLGQGTRQPKAHMWRRRCGSAGKPLQHHARPSPWAPAPETWGRLLLAPLSPAHWSARPPQEDFPGPALPNFTTRRRTTHPEACALRSNGTCHVSGSSRPVGLMVRRPLLTGCTPKPPQPPVSSSALLLSPVLVAPRQRLFTALLPRVWPPRPPFPCWRLVSCRQYPRTCATFRAGHVGGLPAWSTIQPHKTSYPPAPCYAVHCAAWLRSCLLAFLAALPSAHPPPGGPRDRVAQVTFAPAEFPGVHIHTGPFIHSRRQA